MIPYQSLYNGCIHLILYMLWCYFFFPLTNGRFKSFLHVLKWTSHVAELDVLISFAIASDYYEGPTCQPKFLGSLCTNETPCLSAKSLGHPILQSDYLGKGAFVPNDITIGGPQQASIILLTGPNMGGKSTLLRQVCLSVILAQVKFSVMLHNFVFLSFIVGLFPSLEWQNCFI